MKQQSLDFLDDGEPEQEPERIMGLDVEATRQIVLDYVRANGGLRNIKLKEVHDLVGKLNVIMALWGLRERGEL